MVLNSYILHQILGFSGKIFEIQQFNIGVWDMDTDITKSVSCAIGAKHKRIVFITAMIFDDADLYRAPLDSMNTVGNVPNGGIYYYTAVAVVLKANAAGSFNSPSYSSVLINRGVITIMYTTN